ncbi:MAG: WD40 repeat domain-containing protein [Bacteroidetes bacterium]|nr:WD40 repeat domain-containing protein [Bacteroidota bacterium]
MGNQQKSPFKFLDSYAREDKATFFGRDAEIEELYYRVYKSRILVLFGVSGIGKSSLINCGLANKIQESDWFPIQVRRGSDMNRSLRMTLQKCLPGLQSTAQNEPIMEMVQRIFLDNFRPIHFIFDQFEEIFIFGSEKERAELIATVKSIVKSNLQCKFIFSIREEYLASLTEFEKEIPEFLSNRLRINSMTHRNALEVIGGLCRAHGIRLEKECSADILNELSPENAEIDLTYLQIFLDRLYWLALEENPGSQEVIFSKELVKRVGSVKDLLGTFLESEISRLNDQDKSLALTILKSFVSNKGTKRQVTDGEIAAYITTPGRDVDINRVRALLYKFITLRIIRDHDENGKYELRHDSLASKIFEKITIAEKEVNEIREIINNSYDQYLNRGILLSERDFNYIKPYLDILFLNQDKKDFIARSRKELQLKKKRLRAIAISALSAALVIMAGFTVWALIERNNATKIARIATSNELASYSLLTLDKNPTLSFRLAEKAFQTYGGPLAMEALSLSYETSGYYPFHNNLAGHTNDVYSLDYTPHGRKIVSGSFDSTARIWNMDGKELAVLKGHRQKVMSAKFSPDGRFIVTASTDSTVRLWDTAGRLLYTIRDNDQWNYLADFSPDGKYIVTASIAGLATIWDFNKVTFQCNRHCYLAGHEARINAIHFSTDNKYIATTSYDKTARIWNFDGACMAVLKGHTGFLRDIGFSPDNLSVVTSSDDATARIWDLSGKELQVLAQHTAGVTRSDFTPDGRFIITVSDDGSAIIWGNRVDREKISTGHPEEPIPAFNPRQKATVIKEIGAGIGCIDHFAISADSKYFAIGSDDGISQVRSIGGEPAYELRRHNAAVREIRFAGGNDTVITASKDGTIKIWVLRNSECEMIGKTVAQTLNSSISQKKKILVVLNQQNSLSYFNVEKNRLVDFGYQGAGMNVGISPDDKFISTSSFDKTARIWDTAGKEITACVHPLEVRSTEFSPNGNTILTACNDGAARIWDFRGTKLKEYKADNDQLRCASFSPDGKRIITGSANKVATIRNLDGTIVRQLTMHKADVIQARYSPDGKMILTASSDGQAILWSADGVYIARLDNSHRTAIEEVGFSPGSECFFTLSKNPYMIMIWSRKGELLNIINLGDTKGHTHFAQFSADGNSLLVITTTPEKILVKKWPLRTEDILTNVNQKHLLGIIPDFKEELKDFNIREK